MAQHKELVRTVRELVQGRIFRGEWAEGYKIDEDGLRNETNATVRAVRGALKELTDTGLLKRKQRIGTVVAGKLKPQVSTPSITKAYVVTSSREAEFKSMPYFQAIFAGIKQTLANGAELNIFANQGSTSFSITDIPPLPYATLRESGQGIISVEANNIVCLNQWVGEGVPLVAVDFCPAGALFDSVCVDHVRAGYLATEHLLSLGHRTIGFIGERPNFKSADQTWQDRATGYLRAMAEKSNASFQKWWLDIGRSTPNIPKVLPSFQAQVQPTAYVLCSGSLFETTLKTLESMGLKCPGDVSLVCADGSMSLHKGNRISRVVVEYEELGRIAVRMLATRIANRSMVPVRSTLAVDFEIGETSKIL